MTRGCNHHPYIDGYATAIRSGRIPASKKLKQALNYIEVKLNHPDVFIDSGKIKRGVELIEKYFDMKLLDWELFIFALIHCYYRSTDSVVFDEFLIMMGRGNGKNGFISGVAWYLTTEDHGVRGYNVDIVANNEDQAKTSFQDVYGMLERLRGKMKNHFYWTKEIIQGRRTGSYIKYNTSNAKTKDGKRSACLIFDEIHEYENYNAIKVFTSGFGKRKHSRTFYITTNGYVREGVLDDKLRLAEDVLNGTVTALGLLPLIYEIDDEREAEDPAAWVKANPSLPYFPELKKEMDKSVIKMKYESHMQEDFFTKRMNLPRADREFRVTDYEYIKKTNRPLPDLKGLQCVIGVDFVKLGDMASVYAIFRDGNVRYGFGHSWLCTRSADIPRIRVDWKAWAKQGLLTPVDDVEISPDLIFDYIESIMAQYQVKGVAVDNFRYSLIKKGLADLGFTKEGKTLKMVRPSDIMQVVPVIESCFTKGNFVFGDDPLLRWAAYSTKKIRSGKKAGTDTGNYYYGKIEGRSRKTDPFMAVVHAMTIEEQLDATRMAMPLPAIIL